MCDYRHESQKAVRSLPVPPGQVHKVLNPGAYQGLVSAIRKGHARPGHDLQDGRPLSRNSLSMGHYMSPHNFERSLTRMNSKPWQCQWCGSRLPQHLIRQHRVPHNHREYIQHHFHSGCWDARLLAVAVIFGHIPAESLFTPKNIHTHGARRYSGHSGVIEVIRETFRVY